MGGSRDQLEEISALDQIAELLRDISEFEDTAYWTNRLQEVADYVENRAAQLHRVSEFVAPNAKS